MNSTSSKDVAKGFKALRINIGADTYRPTKNHVVINWGYGGADKDNLYNLVKRVINPSHLIRGVVNKIAFFRKMQEAGLLHLIPAWTTDINVAKGWQIAGKDVVVRTLVEGRRGRGITIVGRNDAMPQAPLYTVYTKKIAEFRIHIVGRKIVDMQQRKKRLDAVHVDNQIRNYNNGWIYARQGVNAQTVPKQVQDAALACFKATGLDFGAVDVGWNEHYKKATVYEVNSAPGIEGTTLKVYLKELKKLIK